MSEPNDPQPPVPPGPGEPRPAPEAVLPILEAAPEPAAPPPVRRLLFRLGPGFWPKTVPAEPASAFAAIDEVLKRPYHFARRYLDSGSPRTTANLVLASVALFAIYGLAVGFFQGGAALLLAMVKVPLLVLASYLITLPSLYIFSCLSGCDVRISRLATLLAGSAGMAGLFAVGMAPVAWLFGVSSASLSFMVIFHFGVWVVAAYLALRFLFLAFAEMRDWKLLLGWSILFVVVTFQVATLLRPISWIGEDGLFLDTGKKFFIQHFLESVR